MIETIVIACLVSKFKGYKLKPLFKRWEIYPPIIFTFIYCLLNLSIFFENYYFIRYSNVLEKIYILTFLILIIKHEQYLEAIIGSMSIIIGTLLNKIAIITNGGKMPVFPTLSYITGYYKVGAFAKVNDIHILGNEQSKCKILTDFIDLGYSILSIGDIFIRIFAFLIIFKTIKSINELEFSNPSSI